jgi:hypothetical protein
MKSLIKNGLMFLAAILVLATSCTQNDSEGTGGKGTLSLLLTDAPFPSNLVENTLVTIDKIEIRSTTTATATTTEADNASQYIVLYEGEGKEFDLLDLQNGITEELANVDLDEGSYDLIRMRVTKAEVVLKDGLTTFDLKIPSGSTSGIKIKITPELLIESGVESTIVLDFDVSKSFIVQGNPKTPAGIKGFLFKPSLRAMCLQYTGVISGKVSENATTPVPIADATVEIYREDTVYSSAQTDATGAYALVGLPALTYQMVFSKDGYTSVTVDGVIVKAKETTTQDVTMGKTVTQTTTPTTTP